MLLQRLLPAIRQISSHIVLDGAQLPLSQRGTAPQFSAHVCCGQMAGWIKMPLGREVGLVPGHIVLDSSNQFLAHVIMYTTPSTLSSPPFPLTITCVQTPPNCFSYFTCPTLTQASPTCKMPFSKSLPG